jgi:hypothetical protein
MVSGTMMRRPQQQLYVDGHAVQDDEGCLVGGLLFFASAHRRKCQARVGGGFAEIDDEIDLVGRAVDNGDDVAGSGDVFLICPVALVGLAQDRSFFVVPLNGNRHFGIPDEKIYADFAHLLQDYKA